MIEASKEEFELLSIILDQEPDIITEERNLLCTPLFSTIDYHIPLRKAKEFDNAVPPREAAKNKTHHILPILRIGNN